MAAKQKTASSSTPGPMMNTLLDYPITPEPRYASGFKPVVIGLYGIPGSGKTTLLNSLKQELSEEKFAFYEGSQVIDTLVPDGLDGFKKLDEEEKMNYRIHAMEAIGNECSRRGNVGVVTGHFMFWPEEDEFATPVYTQSDLETFTHIIYLDVRAEAVMQQSLADATRRRPFASVNHLRKWQKAEISQLHHLCRQHAILFTLLSRQEKLVEKTPKLLRDFQHHTEKQNLSLAETALDEAFGDCQDHLKVVLVLDGDRTLAPEDTGTLFWQKAFASQGVEDKKCPLKMLFSGPLGHTYAAFRQATLMYEHRADISNFDALCQEVASKVTMYPEFVSLLRAVGEEENIGAVVVTCGLRHVWEMVLEREGLSKKVKVIGGGCIADGYVVTAEVKTALVQRLREKH